MANHTTRTLKKDEIFIAQLTRTGLVSSAASHAGYGRTQLYVWRKDDAAFAESWDDAIATYTERLEAEADRRAVEGTLKPVYYQGVYCGDVRQYSDLLLIFRLKALKPEMYREATKRVAEIVAVQADGVSTQDMLNRIRTEIYNLDAQN